MYKRQLYNGYHYGFASFDADPDYLARHFNALLTYSHDSNLRMLLARRVDIAVVTRSYLELFLDRHPEMLPECLVSERLYQLYHHQVLLLPNGPLSPAEVAELLNRLQASG